MFSGELGPAWRLVVHGVQALPLYCWRIVPELCPPDPFVPKYSYSPNVGNPVWPGPSKNSVSASTADDPAQLGSHAWPINVQADPL